MAQNSNFGDRKPGILQLSIGGGLTFNVEQFPGTSETGGIPYRTLGRTGEKVSLIGIGGYHLGNMEDEQVAIRIVQKALDNGINFFDNSWDYHEGRSHDRVGKALQGGYREKAFLMSKTDSHSRKGILMQIDDTLHRLRTDHVDLLQFHEVIRMGDPEEIFSEGGAIEGMLKAQEAGKVRYIGFTGHKSPEIHVHMLDVAARNGFRFDTVQMPVNILDNHYDSFTRKVLPRLVEENIGALGMKPISAGVALNTDVLTAPECLRFAMSMPVSVVITGCENDRDIEQALKVAREFKPLTEQERDALLNKTSKLDDGKYEEYKSTNEHDSTMHYSQWLM